MFVYKIAIKATHKVAAVKALRAVKAGLGLKKAVDIMNYGVYITPENFPNFVRQWTEIHFYYHNAYSGVYDHNMKISFDVVGTDIDVPLMW